MITMGTKALKGKIFLLLGQGSSSEFESYEFFLTEGKNTADPIIIRRCSVLLQENTK